MPGSKRNKLKKILSPTPTPTSDPIPVPGTGPSSDSLADPVASNGNGGTPALSGSPGSLGSETASPKKHHSLHSALHLFHHDKPHKSNSAPPGGGALVASPNANALAPQSSIRSAESGTSIVSDPANYMSDQALEQDLQLEAMAERQGSIGSGLHREQDGVGDLSSLSLDDRASSTGASASASASQSQSALHSSSHVSVQSAGSGTHHVSPNHRPAPPPPVPAGGGGMYGARQAMTAEGLMYGGEGKKKKKSSKQRFEERQARRKEAILHSAPPSDPAWTEQLERERQTEIRVITEACNTLDRYLHEIAPDGHCMYNAISDQLLELGLIKSHQASNPVFARRTAANYLRANRDDFIAFLPSVNGEDTKDATEHDGVMTPAEFNQYCRNVEETGEWGGEPEIQALSRAFDVPIHVFQAGPPTVVSHGGAGDAAAGASTAEQSAAVGDRVVRITYHRRMYGLGEHYNSLRKNGT